jgi:hypothetical protein
MCRKAGRRCPSHTNEEAIEARNEERREQYAAKVLRDKTVEFLKESGVNFYRGDSVKDAYFHGQEAFDMAKFEQVVDQPHYEPVLNDFWFSKPANGGLWTAPGEQGEDGVKTAWTVWSRENDFRVSDNPVHPIRIRKQAVIVAIDKEEDVEALCKAFPSKGIGFSYEAMAKAGIDGVRLTQRASNASKSFGDGKLKSFSMWDIDSTVWISNENISAGKAVKQSKWTPVYSDLYEDDEEDEEYSWDELEAQLKISSETPIDFEEIDRNTRANSSYGKDIA